LVPHRLKQGQCCRKLRHSLRGRVSYAGYLNVGMYLRAPTHTHTRAACSCTHTHTHAHACTLTHTLPRAHTHAHTHTRTHAHTHTHVCTHAHAHTHAPTHIHMHAHTYAQMCAQHTHTYGHTCAQRTHTHTHTHTHIILQQDPRSPPLHCLHTLQPLRTTFPVMCVMIGLRSWLRCSRETCRPPLNRCGCGCGCGCGCEYGCEYGCACGVVYVCASTHVILD